MALVAYWNIHHIFTEVAETYRVVNIYELSKVIRQ
jgi:hypothetical protein